MNIFSKMLHKAGDALNFNKKFYDIPTVTGGFDVFRNMFWEDGVSQKKNLSTYSKSLYVYACVTKIAQKTASIDWELFRIKNKAGDKEQVFVSPVLDLLYRPNPWQTKGEFFEKYMINKKLAGEAFILKVRNKGGKVVELWNLRPDFMTIVKDKQTFIKGYEFQINGGEIITFAPEDIIHDAYPNPLDEYGGVSPLSAAQVRVDTEISAVTYQKNFFKNNARPDFFLMSENKIQASQKDEIKEGWEKRLKGVENSGKGAFLDGGLKYQQVSITQREMDYIDSLKMTRDDILTAFGVPKPIVAITDDVNLANAKTAMEIFLSETIVPEIKRLTEKLNENLVYVEFGEIYYIDFVDPVPTNEKAVAEVQDIQIKNGSLLINEAREQVGLEPIVGGWSLYMPLSNVAVGGLSKSSNSKNVKKDNREVFRGRQGAYKFLETREVVEKMVIKGIAEHLLSEKKKEGTRSLILPEIREKYYEQVNKAIDNKGEAFKPSILTYGEEQKARVLSALNAKGKSIDTKALDGLINVSKENKLLAEISLPFLTDFLVSAGNEAMNIVNPAETFIVTDQIARFIKERAKETAKSVNDTTIEKLSRTLAEGLGSGEGIADLTARVNVVYDEYPTYRAEMIARTEATAANNRGFQESYEQSGVANAKEWINSGDGRVRDEHSDAGVGGEIVGVNETFSNGLEYPSEPNCRCVLGPAFKE